MYTCPGRLGVEIGFSEAACAYRRKIHQLLGSNGLGSSGRVIQGWKKVVIGSGDKSCLVLFARPNPDVTSESEHSQLY